MSGICFTVHHHCFTVWAQNKTWTSVVCNILVCSVVVIWDHENATFLHLWCSFYLFLPFIHLAPGSCTWKFLSKRSLSVNGEPEAFPPSSTGKTKQRVQSVPRSGRGSFFCSGTEGCVFEVNQYLPGMKIRFKKTRLWTATQWRVRWGRAPPV